MNAPQSMFAKLVGVSVELVESWEQGLRASRAPWRGRLLDEMHRDPSGYFARLVRSREN